MNPQAEARTWRVATLILCLATAAWCWAFGQLGGYELLVGLMICLFGMAAVG